MKYIRDLRLDNYMTGAVHGILAVMPSYTCQEILKVLNNQNVFWKDCSPIKIIAKRFDDKIDDSYFCRSELTHIPAHNEEFAFCLSYI